MSEEFENKMIDALATIKLQESKILELTTAAAVYSQRAEAAEKRAEAAEAALERDRATVANSVTAINDAIEKRQWLLESRGPFAWDDDRYREEFSDALNEISAPVAHLKEIAGNWSNCATDKASVDAARVGIPKFKS